MTKINRFLLIGLVMAIVGVLVAGFASPIFADSPDNGEATPADEEAWETMHEACESGDWEVIAEAAKEMHGEDFDYIPCHDEDNHAPANHWGGMGGHMGGGMMGGMH